jgi:hypothetical protein
MFWSAARYEHKEAIFEIAAHVSIRVLTRSDHVCVHVQDLGVARGKGHDEQLQAAAAENVSRETTPPPDVLAGQPSTVPKRNEPSRSGNETSIEYVSFKLLRRCLLMTDQITLCIPRLRSTPYYLK